MQVKFGAIVTNGSGKIGGQFISGDRSGSSLRTKNFKTKNSQINLISQRGIVALMSRAWRELTEAQRQLWQSYAATKSVQNNGYGGVYLSGFQTFMQVNCSFFIDGDSVITIPSVNLDALPITINSFQFVNEFPTLTRGQVYGGGRFVCLLPSDDPAYNPASPIALVVSTNTAPSALKFSNDGTSTYNRPSKFISDSLSSTEDAIAALGGDAPAANWARAKTDGGYSDWCIGTDNAILAIMSAFDIPDFPYWSNYWGCSSYANLYVNAYFVGFGGMGPSTRDTPYATCAVRLQNVTANSSLSLTLSDDLPANVKVKVSVTKPVSLGISNPRNTFTDLGIFDTSSGSVIDLTSAYESKFGSLSGLSGKIFIKAFVFDSVTKQRSNAFISSTTLS